MRTREQIRDVAMVVAATASPMTNFIFVLFTGILLGMLSRRVNLRKPDPPALAKGGGNVPVRALRTPEF